MLKGLAMENDHFEVGIAAVADFAAGDTDSDVVNMKNHNRVRFIVHWGVGATGIVKLTAEACDDVVPTNTEEVPFWYRITASGGTPGTPTRATAAGGVSNTAGSNQVIEIEVLAEDLAASGYSYVRLHVDETTDSPLLGGVLVQMLEPMHAGDAQESAVV